MTKRISVEQMPPVENEEQKRHLIRYVNFINSRPERDLIKDGKYFNVHHIVPKSLNGCDDRFNLIKLTHREHYIAHLILWRTYGGKMAQAFYYMTKISKSKIINGRLFEILKIENSFLQYMATINRCKITNGTENKIINKGEAIPPGWYQGQTNKIKTKPHFEKILINNGFKSTYINKDEKVPDGWSTGSFIKRRFVTNGIENKKINVTQAIPFGYYIGITSNKFFVTDGVKNKLVSFGENIPNGFYIGFTKTKNLKGTVWINNGTRSLQVKKDEIPENWNFGMCGERKWINDGKINRLILINEKMPKNFIDGRLSIGFWIHNENEEKYCNDETVPNGYEIGRLFSSTKDTVWITNGVENKMIKSNEKIPIGYRKGRISRKKKYRFITNGVKNKYLYEGEELPDGWRFGAISTRKKHVD